MEEAAATREALHGVRWPQSNPKVLAADLVDTDKLNNHFLLTAASLGNQLLQTYSLHDEKNNTLIDIVPQKVADMMFDIISGKLVVQPLSGSFSIDEIISRFS